MVRGAAALAARLGVSPLAIGLTVVAFGTSAPELAVNVTAAWGGHGDISFGNIFGSNLANIGLILAVTAFVRPLDIASSVIRREVPMMLLATAVAIVIGMDDWLVGGEAVYDRADGLVLLLLFLVFIYYTVNDVLVQRAERERLEEGVSVTEMALPIAFGLTIAGLVGLVIGGRLTVDGAESLARAAGVPEVIIGLTLVAIGTSLPELVASVIAAMRGHAALAIGNVVGSNIFNLALVLGTTSTIRAVPVPVRGHEDHIAVLLMSLLLWALSFTNQGRIIKWEGVLLLAIYILHMVQRVLF